jgi:hypothetical protein
MKMFSIFLPFIIFLIINISSLGCIEIEQQPNFVKDAKFPHITRDGAWCWFADQRAVQFSGKYNKTYIGWVDRKYGGIYVGAFDNSKKKIQYAYLKTLYRDDHNNPAILVRPDKHIVIFYSAHLGKNLFYKKSKFPENINYWGKEKTIPLDSGRHGITYPNPVQLTDENNSIYLFWRGKNHQQFFAASKNLIIWSKPFQLVQADTAPYFKFFSKGKGKIHITFTNNHPQLDKNNSIYYMYYQQGAFYRANGSLIRDIANLPIPKDEADLVYRPDENSGPAWIWDIVENNDNESPVISYAVIHNASDHRYFTAEFDSDNWNHIFIDFGGGSIDPGKQDYYSAGISMNPSNSDEVFYSKRTNKFFEIFQARKTTTSGWEIIPLTENSERNNFRPKIPYNYDATGIKLIWMYGNYFSYADYRTGLLYSH